MSTYSFTGDHALIEQLKQHYQNAAITPPPHSCFAAKLPTVRLTIYNSKKIVFQGQDAEKEAQQWHSQGVSIPDTPRLPEHFSTYNVIGSDEVGNGSYFGPLVVVATYVPKESQSLLKQYHIRDSKQMSDAEMKRIYNALKDKVMYQAITITPKKYNAIQPRYNAVHMKAVLHNQAIYRLEQRVRAQHQVVDAILVDEFTSPKNYKHYIHNEEHQPSSPFYSITKGEQHHLAVALASIFARVLFLNELERESTEVGIPLPIGAGANVDDVASTLIRRYGETILYDVAKYHFANTKKARALAKK